MIVYAGDDIERAIRDLKRKVDKDGVLRELRDKRFFLTRKERRRLKDHVSILRAKKAGRMRARYDMRHEG